MSPPKTNTNVTLDELYNEVRALKSRTTSDRIWEISLKALIPLTLLIWAWMISLQVRVSVIESNRFTDKDAREMEVRLKENLPPLWLKNTVKDIQQQDRLQSEELRKMSLLLESMKYRLDKLEEKK